MIDTLLSGESESIRVQRRAGALGSARACRPRGCRGASNLRRGVQARSQAEAGNGPDGVPQVCGNPSEIGSSGPCPFKTDDAPWTASAGTAKPFGCPRHMVTSVPWSPLCPRAMLTAGRIYERKLGQYQDALHAYESVLAAYPHSLEAGEARERVRVLREKIKDVGHQLARSPDR